MDYEKKYQEALVRARHALDCDRNGLVKTDTPLIFSMFPELADERIKKEIIEHLRLEIETECTLSEEEGNRWIAWLKKQGESDKHLYIRFGDIPSDEKSKIYRNEEEIGFEEGVSVYPAFETNGDIIIGLSMPITKTTLHTQQHLLEYENRPCYLVTGDYVGKGSDGEPLIKNIRIIKEINHYRIKQDKKNNTYVIKNTPHCGISCSNEEIPKWLEKQGEKTIQN